MSKQKTKFIFAIVFTVVLFIPNIILGLNNNLWWDEIITVRYCRTGTIAEIVRWAARDVHPPLYYIMLHIFIKIFGDSLIAMKLFSAVAHLGILLCGLFFVRKHFGYKAMLFFDLYTTVMPYMFYYSVEVRMYEWAMFYVVLCCIMAYYVLERGEMRDWIGLFMCGLCCAYTHYYSLVSAVMIYAILLLCLIIERDMQKIIKYAVAGGAIILGYLPWLPVFFNQTSAVSEDFWVEGKSIKDYLSQMFDAGVVPYSLYINLGLILVACVTLIVKRKALGKKIFIWALGCILAFVTIFGTVYVFSVLFSPIIMVRYLLIAMMLLAMGIAVSCRYMPKWMVGAFLLFYLLNGVLSFPEEYRIQNVHAEESVAILEEKCNGNLYSDIEEINDYLEIYDSACVSEGYLENSENYLTGDIIITRKSEEVLEQEEGIVVEQIAPFELKTIAAYMYRVE